MTTIGVVRRLRVKANLDILYCQVQNGMTQLLHVITTRAVTSSFSYETRVNQESNTPQNGALTREMI